MAQVDLYGTRLQIHPGVSPALIDPAHAMDPVPMDCVDIASKPESASQPPNAPYGLSLQAGPSTEL